jgi:hypothetical protein
VNYFIPKKVIHLRCKPLLNIHDVIVASPPTVEGGLSKLLLKEAEAAIALPFRLRYETHIGVPTGGNHIAQSTPQSVLDSVAVG